MELENKFVIVWVNNVLIQLISVIGEKQKINTKSILIRLIFTGLDITHRTMVDICLKIRVIWFIITNLKNTIICLTLPCGGNFII